MTDQPYKKASPQAKVGLLAEGARTARLVWRLLRDQRVARITKMIIPGLVGAYLLVPVDLLPDFLPLLGQVDDFMLVLFGAKLFIDLCPPEIVREHKNRMSGRPPTQQPDFGDGEVVDADYHVID